MKVFVKDGAVRAGLVCMTSDKDEGLRSCKPVTDVSSGTDAAILSLLNVSPSPIIIFSTKTTK